MTPSAPITGMLLSAAAFLFFTCFDTASKFLSRSYSVFQIMSVEFVTATVLLLAFAVLKDWSKLGSNTLRMTKPHLHLIRGGFQILGQSLAYLAIPHLSLAEFYVIVFCMPAVTVLKAGWFLKERADAHIWPVLAANFLGVLIAMRPDRGVDLWALVALAGIVSLAGGLVVLRRMGRTETPEMCGVSTAMALALGALAITPFVYKPMEPGDFALAVLGGAYRLRWRKCCSLPLSAWRPWRWRARRSSSSSLMGRWRGIWYSARCRVPRSAVRRRNSHRRQCRADLRGEPESAAQASAEGGRIAACRLIADAICAQRLGEGFGVGGLLHLEGVESGPRHEQELIAEHVAGRADFAVEAIALAKQARLAVSASVAEHRKLQRDQRKLRQEWGASSLSGLSLGQATPKGASGAGDWRPAWWRKANRGDTIAGTSGGTGSSPST